MSPKNQSTTITNYTRLKITRIRFFLIIFKDKLLHDVIVKNQFKSCDRYKLKNNYCKHNEKNNKSGCIKILHKIKKTKISSSSRFKLERDFDNLKNVKIVQIWQTKKCILKVLIISFKYVTTHLF